MFSWADRKLIKFLAVGVLNTLVGATLMFLLYNAAHCPYWFSSSANYIVGSLLAYVLNKRLTFGNTSRGWRPAVRFIAVIAVCYFAAYGAAKPLMEWLLSGFSASFRGNAALALGMIVFTALNYFGQRYFAFREDERHEP